ncbi:hypothetical protein VTJ49DRAFT_1528 [Mycothermus thermophilus]|uniref:Uncharacterized protein n=1 Tax=Humicola insolens TaxID=85995 RepID=A0ABR3VC91_HUMIN
MLLSTALLLATAGVASATNKGCKPKSSSTFNTKTVTPSSSSSSSSWTGRVTKYPDSCTYRPTQTYYATSGCSSISCDMGFCVTDAPATVSCGCPTVWIETQYTTVCPTTTPCQQCYTGWGTFIVTESCGATSTSAALAAPTD